MDESASRGESTRGTVTDLRIGSYRIIQPLGTGGMSSVYRAVHVETGHEVALKVLTRTLARNSTLLQRFLREARSAETLEHVNIVTIYDRGIDLKGRHYLVLEYVAGGDFPEITSIAVVLSAWPTRCWSSRTLLALSSTPPAEA